MRSRNVIDKGAPQRTCLACRQVRAKPELVRLVRTAEGHIEIDVRGKRAGRGAYLCRLAACWETGLKPGRLEHALHASVNLDNRERLLAEARELLRGDQW